MKKDKDVIALMLDKALEIKELSYRLDYIEKVGMWTDKDKAIYKALYDLINHLRDMVD